MTTANISSLYANLKQTDSLIENQVPRNRQSSGLNLEPFSPDTVLVMRRGGCKSVNYIMST